jgi:choline dehydrogenase-like flavoprotein
MTFTPAIYTNMVTENSVARERLILQYLGPRNDFDIIIVGSGMGGGILADDLADRVGDSRRILLLEAGTFLYPTHVYNLCRFPNFSIAKHFGCATFWQVGDSNGQNYIGEQPQLNFGGRSIFWSGLIPAAQPWELDFFPDAVRADLAGGLLDEAGEKMNHSLTLGGAARQIVGKLRIGPLAEDFDIVETPRALHQPYLRPDGTPRDAFFTESTGVFNTAELVINQLGLTPGLKHGDGPGLHLLLNSYVEDVQDHGGTYVLVTRHTLTGEARLLSAPTVVLAGGSIESPKLLRRSSLFPTLPEHAQALTGRGLTDHPTSNEIQTIATEIDGFPIPRSAHAKIVFYSRGRRKNGEIVYPFNVEMNVNHEWWHLRENDPDAEAPNETPAGASRIDVKFSFANPLDDANEIRTPPPFEYVPEIVFRNQSWMDHLSGNRFPALAGWHKSNAEIFALMNDVVDKAFSQFRDDGAPARPFGRFGEGGLGFGWGTVHHAVGSLRMPFRPSFGAPIDTRSVVDEDLRVAGTQGLHVCDMSVAPVSTAANPVRTLAALALRLSRHLA